MEVVRLAEYLGRFVQEGRCLPQLAGVHERARELALPDRRLHLATVLGVYLQRFGAEVDGFVHLPLFQEDVARHAVPDGEGPGVAVLLFIGNGLPDEPLRLVVLLHREAEARHVVQRRRDVSGIPAFQVNLVALPLRVHGEIVRAEARIGNGQHAQCLRQVFLVSRLPQVGQRPGQHVRGLAEPSVVEVFPRFLDQFLRVHGQGKGKKQA